MYGSVFLFGMGYYMVSLDVTENRGIVWLGICGKLTFFLFLGSSHLVGRATLAAFLGGCGDLLFAVFFLLFLWQTRDMGHPAERTPPVG